MAHGNRTVVRRQRAPVAMECFGRRGCAVEHHTARRPLCPALSRLLLRQSLRGADLLHRPPLHTRPPHGSACETIRRAEQSRPYTKRIRIFQDLCAFFCALTFSATYRVWRPDGRARWTIKFFGTLACGGMSRHCASRESKMWRLVQFVCRIMCVFLL